MTPAGIEPATFRFVAQHLNHSADEIDIDDPEAIKMLTDPISMLPLHVMMYGLCAGQTLRRAVLHRFFGGSS